MTRYCPFYKHHECNRGCRGFECRAREDLRGCDPTRLYGKDVTLMIEDTYDTKAAPFGMAVDDDQWSSMSAPERARAAMDLAFEPDQTVVTWYDEVAHIPPELMDKIFRIDPSETPFMLQSRQCGRNVAIARELPGVWIRTLEEVEREIEVLEASGDDEMGHLLREERARLLAEQDLKGLDE